MRKDELRESEQHKMAYLEDLPVEDIDLDARFKRIDDPEALAEFARVRAESEARMMQINAETLAFIESENAKDYSGQKKSEQYTIASLGDPSSGGGK